MGLQSAMTTALTGLQAAETTIDVVGNNIANSSTVGFKESDTIFATQFLQTQSIGSAPAQSRGGTNPRQIGLGVKVAEISPDFSQGTIEISSNPLDVAIQGDGFLVVQGGQGGRFFTRNGQLKLNANNEVVTVTGQRVLGFGVNDQFQLNPTVEPLRIPLGEQRVAQASSAAQMAGVLNPSVDLGATPGIVSSAVLGDGKVDPPGVIAGEDLDSTDLLKSDPPTLDANISTSFTVGGGSNPLAGVYQYRIAFVDAFGNEGTPSAPFTIDSRTGGDGSLDLTAIPPADGTIYVSRNIYRTEDGGNNFYLAGSIGDAATTTFSDSVADATLANNAALDSNVIDPGTYSYYVTFLDPINGDETRPSKEIQSISVSEAGKRIRIDLSDIVNPGSLKYTDAKLYRNIAGKSEEFHSVTDLGAIPSDPATGWSYIDSSSNADIEGNDQIDLDGPKANTGTFLKDVIIREGSSTRNLFEAGTLSFKGSKGGADVDAQELDITDLTTMQDLVDFMADTLGIHEGSADPGSPLPSGAGSVSIDPETGIITVTSNMGERNELDISLTSFQLTPTGASTTQSLGIPFGQTQAADGPGTSTEFLVYDSLGIPMSVRVTTVLEARDGNSTTYRWYANSGENEPGETGNSTTVIGDGLLTFDQNGTLLPGPPARISVQRNETASESPLEVTLNFDSVRSLAETDALNNPTSSLNMTRQDGFPPGVLTNFIVTEGGRIQGQFSNGTQRDLGQMIMAKFANSGGLQQVGDSLFAVGVNSGDPFYGNPGEDGIGGLTAGAVELSNTDIGQNLIELILASTQYRGGARVISAAQELLDELLALRR